MLQHTSSTPYFSCLIATCGGPPGVSTQVYRFRTCARVLSSRTFPPLPLEPTAEFLIPFSPFRWSLFASQIHCSRGQISHSKPSLSAQPQRASFSSLNRLLQQRFLLSKSSNFMFSSFLICSFIPCLSTCSYN